MQKSNEKWLVTLEKMFLLMEITLLIMMCSSIMYAIFIAQAFTSTKERLQV